MSKDLTPFARAGYLGEVNANPDSRSASLAHSLGAWLARTGRCMPYDVSRKRGYLFHTNDMIFRMTFRMDPQNAWRREK